MVSYLGGIPSLARGYPISGWGGTSSLARVVTHPWLGVPQDGAPSILIWPGGTPTCGQGVPHPWPGRQVPCLGGTPILTWPGGIQSLAGGSPRKDIGSVEVLWMEMGYPRKHMRPMVVLWDGDGVHPERTWDQWKYYGIEMGYPQKGHETSGSIMGWRWGTPRKDLRPVEVLWDGDGVPPGKDMGPVEVLWDRDGVPPVVWADKLKQEIHPAWMQEAYWLQHIKYSICYPKWGTPWQGYPQPGLMGVPKVGYSLPGLMGSTCGGVSPAGLLGGTQGGVPLPGVPQPDPMGGTWGGVPPGRGTPMARWGSPPLDLAGVPPRPPGVGRHMSKHNLPVVGLLQFQKSWIRRYCPVKTDKQTKHM